MAASHSQTPTNVPQWISQYKESFLPPVCNKMLHNEGQLKVMFVGGPNIRSDFHIEEGEEIFYQVHGAMTLRVMERGVPRDIVIKEGEIYVLPSRIPHSPQRFADTMGLVIERERLADEKDGLRWYTTQNTPLFEEWFHCFDLGVQLKPVIERFFASEQHKSGQPLPGTISPHPPVTLDTHNHGKKSFSSSGEFKVWVHHGKARNADWLLHNGEVWLWQLEGQANIVLATAGPEQSIVLAKNHSYLAVRNTKFKLENSEDGETLVIFTDPLANKGPSHSN